MKTKLLTIKLIARIALGIVWVYEGFVPKLLSLRDDQADLVQRSGLVWGTPELTLQVMGITQIALGVWLLVGWAERLAVAIATIWMLALMVLVANGNPAMLTDPYGALVKDLCLIACACTVWMLAPDVGCGKLTASPTVPRV